MAKIFTPEEHRLWLNQLPAKRIGAGVLIFNEKDELLIVKPNYTNYWTVPGGVTEAAEAPLAAAIREVQEELGVDVANLLAPAIVNYLPEYNGQLDFLQFIFTMRVPHGDAFLQSVTLGLEELEEVLFTATAQLEGTLSGDYVQSVTTYLQQAGNGVLYLENGSLPKTLVI